MKIVLMYTGIATATVAWNVEAFLENHIVAVLALIAAALMLRAGVLLEEMEK